MKKLLKKIGISKEISSKGKEKRVILLPQEVKKLVDSGHKVIAEKGLGLGIGIPDTEYREAGASITSDRRKVYHQDVVVKLKPPLSREFALLNHNLIFSMLHAEQNPTYVTMLKKTKSKAIAMELIRNSAGERLVQCTHMTGEQGMLMAYHLACKTPQDCKVLVLGYGAVSSGALEVAYSLGSKIKILRKSEFNHIRHFLRGTDILVNGIAWPKEERERKQYLLTRNDLKLLSQGAIMLDLSVDYPNPIETAHPSFINKPVYAVDGIRHISIFGYPGLVPYSSSKRYSKQVLALLLQIASTDDLENLPNSLKKAVVDPDKFFYNYEQ